MQFKGFRPDVRRSMIVLGAVGLTALGATAVGTSAAFTDTAVAASSFGSSADFLPAPKYLGCSGGGGSVTLRWEHLGPGYTYDIKLFNAWGGTWNPTIPPNKGDVISIDVSAYNNIYETASSSRIEVHSVRNGQVGTSWVGENLWAFTLWNIKCDGKVSSGTQSLMAPAPGDALSRNAARQDAPSTSAAPTSVTGTAAAASTSTAASSTPSAASSSTTTTTTSAPSSTTTTAPSSTTTTAPSTTTAAQTTTTTAAPAAEEAVVAPSGDLAIANKSSSGTYAAQVSSGQAVVSDASGATVFSTPVGKKAMVQWASGSDELWIIESDALYRAGGAVGWTKTTVDPKSAEVPAEIAALIG
ncbi:hypothetical protein ACWFRB_01245 [Rhodococcus sp. NPDC055112]